MQEKLANLTYLSGYPGVRLDSFDWTDKNLFEQVSISKAFI